MPTLYIADGKSFCYVDGVRGVFYIKLVYTGLRSKPKLSIVELVLYNMAAMLAGVAAGYDVRLSNISPLHPRLQPNR